MEVKVLTYDDKTQSFVNSVCDDECYEKGEYFPKKTGSFSMDEEKIKNWFHPSNNYPEKTLAEIRKGSTLQGLLSKHSNYLSAHNVISENDKVQTSIEDEKNAESKSFYETYKRITNSFSKLGNGFVKVQTDTNKSFITFTYIQAQKCRINGDEIEINSDWENYDKKNSEKIKLFPNFTKIKGGIQESVLHIKNEVDGFDYYGIIEKMEAALILNEKEYRRNNWQKNQVKNGFKKDFAVVTNKMVTEDDEKAVKKKNKEISGDKNAGGLHLVHSVNEGSTPFIPLQQDYEFDFTKDDTQEQLFTLFEFPRSLFGIKSGAAFSVEQVESDYEQYLQVIENAQETILSYFDEVYKLLWKVESNLKAVNIPPSQVIERYMPYLSEEQKAVIINKVFTKYGVEL